MNLFILTLALAVAAFARQDASNHLQSRAAILKPRFSDDGSMGLQRRALQRRMLNPQALAKGAQSMYQSGAKMLTAKRPEFPKGKAAPPMTNELNNFADTEMLAASQAKGAELQRAIEQQKKNLPLLKKLGGVKSDKNAAEFAAHVAAKHKALGHEVRTQQALQHRLNKFDKDDAVWRAHYRDKEHAVNAETEWEKKNSPLAHYGRKAGVLPSIEQKQGWKPPTQKWASEE